MSSPHLPVDPAVDNSPSPATIANRRRSTRVWHEAALLVSIPMLDGSSIKLEGRTFAVNVHGGLLQLPVDVHPGQTMQLTNPATQMTENCHVVRSERATESQLKVGFAFERPSPYFWAIPYPPEDWAFWRQKQDSRSETTNAQTAPSAVTVVQRGRRRSTRGWHEATLLVRIPMPDSSIVEKEVKSFAVNVQGGLLRLSIDVQTGQTFEVMNPATQLVRGCRVVRTERAVEGYLKVAFAFDEPSPHFWAIACPPEDWGIKES